MLFGHNSNVTVGADTVHVQTEDRGANHAFIDTTVHWQGRVLHRRTNNYQDLLPLDADERRGSEDPVGRSAPHCDRRNSFGHAAAVVVHPYLRLRRFRAPKAAPSMAAALKVELINAQDLADRKTCDPAIAGERCERKCDLRRRSESACGRRRKFAAEFVGLTEKMEPRRCNSKCPS